MTHPDSGAAAVDTHTHVFDDGNPLAERKTAWATGITAVMMVIEIVGGWGFNSMALLADGWHMSSHALALGLAVLAYRYARKYARDTRFTFGTWKIEILGGYTSAILLLGVAVLMVFQSVERLFAPTAIHYDEAIATAALGLAVNLVCAWLLKDGHHHGHDHDRLHHEHGPAHGHAHSHDHDAPAHTVDPRAGEDLNLRSAYLHVIADAATSVLAILALFGGKWLGANWLDPVMGIVGAALVTVWALGLLRQSGRVLLDAQMQAPVVQEIRDAIAQGPYPARITDLHVWLVGRGKYACIVALQTAALATPDDFRRLLAVHEELVHVTVEVDPA